MKIYSLSAILILSLLVSCGSGRLSQRAGQVPLWSHLPADDTQSQIISKPSALFVLQTQAYIDSLIHFEAKYKRSKDPSVDLLLPLPNLDGSTDDYYFRPIYDAGPRADSTILGFIGIQKTNKRDISSLYLKNGKIIVKWNTDEKEWLLSYIQTRPEGDVYRLQDISPSDDAPAAPIPEHTY